MAVNLLLFGRNGNGKSSTGNSILGRSVFMPRGNSQSPADKIINGSSEGDGKKITVVDGPYITDTNMNDPDDINLALECADRAMSFCFDGFHAVIIILKYGVRYTKQEKDTIFLIREMFGENVIKDHGICVFTYGDSFARDMEDEVRTFESWCMKQTGDITDLFKECNNRYALFNNRATDEWSKRLQRDTLMTLVDMLQGRRYTMFEYEQAVAGRNGLKIRSKLPQFQEETRKVLGQISVVLDKIDVHRRAEYSKRELSRMKKKLEDHKRYLQNEADGTNLLNNLLDELNVTEMSLNTKLRIADVVIQGLQDGDIRREAQADENSYFATGPTRPQRDNILIAAGRWLWRKVCDLWYILRNAFGY